jgi:hypothetical protein
MKFQFKIVKSKIFLLFFSLYIIFSLTAFFLTTGGYSIILFLLYIAPFYLFAWVAVAILCFKLKRIRYSYFFIYPILFFQSIAILFNIADGGFYGITCRTKNFLQSFFDPSSCTGLWMSQQNLIYIVVLCLLFLFIFVCDLVRLTFKHPEDR